MALTVRQSTAGQAWVAHPNRALTPAQQRWLLAGAAVLAFVIALAFTAFGAWPVLPFAGLEIAALWCALHHQRRHENDEERLDIGDREVVVTRRSGSRREEHRFPRYWVRLRIERPPGRPGCRLFLRSHGRELEIGLLLTDPQKQTLAEALKTRLGAIPQ